MKKYKLDKTKKIYWQSAALISKNLSKRRKKDTI